jgi:hypothetical protein
MPRIPACQKALSQLMGYKMTHNSAGFSKILPTSFPLTRCRTFVTFPPSSNTKERGA